MDSKIKMNFFFQDVDECKTEGDPESQETKEDNVDKSDNNLENISEVIEEEETITKPPNLTAEPGLESNNDSGIVPNCSQGKVVEGRGTIQ